MGQRTWARVVCVVLVVLVVMAAVERAAAAAGGEQPLLQPLLHEQRGRERRTKRG